MANVVATGGKYSEKELNDGKPLAAVGYFPICGLPTFLIPMFAAKDNGYAQFHARQSAVLYILGLGLGISVAVITMVLGLIGGLLKIGFLTTVISCLGNILALAVGGGFFVLMVIGIINALQGQAKELPVIGPYSTKLPF